MKDKFGIELEVGDVLALTDMHRDYSPILCVLIGATPNFLKVKCIYMFAHKPHIMQTRFTSKNLVKVNEEQIESLTRMMFETRCKYVMEETIHTSQGVVNELLSISEKIKKER